MIVMSFDALTAKVEGWYRDERMTHQDIATRLTAEGLAPALGASAWSWQAVDKLMVHAAAQRRALQGTPGNGTLPGSAGNEKGH